jgi:hypothetical protein
MKRSKFALAICLTAFFCLLASCSADWHLRKAIRKNPMIVTKDTVVLNDTFYTPEVHVTDTFVTSKYDTIELIKDKLHIQIIRQNDTIRLAGTCKSDTLVRVVRIPVEKIVYKEAKKDSPFKYFAVAVWGLCVLLLIMSGARR